MTEAKLLPTVWIMRTQDHWYPIQPSDRCKPEDHGRGTGMMDRIANAITLLAVATVLHGCLVT